MHSSSSRGGNVPAKWGSGGAQRAGRRRGTALAGRAFVLGRDGNSAALAALCARNKEQEPSGFLCCPEPGPGKPPGMEMPLGGAARRGRDGQRVTPPGCLLMPGPLPPDQKRAAPANGTSPAHPASCKHGDGGHPALPPLQEDSRSCRHHRCCSVSQRAGWDAWLQNLRHQERRNHGCTRTQRGLRADSPPPTDGFSPCNLASLFIFPQTGRLKPR